MNFVENKTSDTNTYQIKEGEVVIVQSPKCDESIILCTYRNENGINIYHKDFKCIDINKLVEVCQECGLGKTYTVLPIMDDLTEAFFSPEGVEDLIVGVEEVKIDNMQYKLVSHHIKVKYQVMETDSEDYRDK